MPANRVAALGAVLAQLGVLCAAIAGAFPGKYGDVIAAVGALAGKALVVWKFLDGSQKYDALQTSQVRPVVQLSTTAGDLAVLQSRIGATGPLTSGGLQNVVYNTSSGLADEEPGDPDGLPHLPTALDPPVDGNDQVHA